MAVSEGNLISSEDLPECKPCKHGALWISTVALLFNAFTAPDGNDKTLVITTWENKKQLSEGSRGTNPGIMA